MSEETKAARRGAALDAVERLRGVVTAGAEEAERLRTLPRATVEAIRAARLFALAAPEAVGGDELGAVVQLEVFEAMTRIDTSAGWALLIGSMTAALAGAYLGDAAIPRIFGAERWPIVAGLQAPNGVAVPVPGGYRVSGRWGWGSGVRHADWVFTAAILASDGPPSGGAGGPPPMLSVAVPTKDLVLEDTWFASGLRGSGSCHYGMVDLFVPSEQTCPFPAAPPLRGGPLYRMPLVAFLGAAHMGFALGAARRALDEVVATSRTRVRVWSQSPALHHAPLHMDLGRAEARLAAARAYSIAALSDAERAMEEGRALSPVEWSAVRLATTYATDVAAEVVTVAYRQAGGAALFETSALQRYFRDIHAATQHVAATDDAYEHAGRLLLGIGAPHPIMAPRPEP